MRFTAIDLELNQPNNEIIQIGALAFDTDIDECIGSFNMYHDPGVPVNWGYVLNTGQTLQQLLPKQFYPLWDSRRSPSAISDFWGWHKTIQAGKKFIQWGRGDMKTLTEQSQGLGYPSHLRVLDLKQIYRFMWQPSCRLEKQSSLTAACKNMGVEPPNPAHDAHQDAYSTGLLFMKMFKQVKALNDLLKECK